MPSENLWTQFNGRKIAAERAKKDWNGRDLTSIVTNNSTISIKSGSNSTADGSFTLNQSTDSTVTLAAATTSSDGVMSSTDKTKLDGIATGATKVEDGTFNGDIVVTDSTGHATTVNVYTHPQEGTDPSQSTSAVYAITVDRQGHVSSTATVTPSSLGITVDATNGVTDTVSNVTYKYTHPSAGPGSDKSVGDTNNQTPGFGDTFKVTSETVNTDGHTTAVAEHTVTIPSAVAVASSSGTGGSNGLMTAADKEKLDGLPSAVNDGTLSITVGSEQAQTFTANQAGNTTVTIPNAASASGGSAATGGLMTDTDKANLDNATAVIPAAATAQNQLVDTAAMQAAIANLGGYEVVSNSDPDTHEPILPAGETASTKIIYLVKNTSAPGDDKYYEWICTNTTGPVWELIGETSIDMTGYAQIPSNKTATHIVTFGATDELVDSGYTVSQLENEVTTITVGSGTAISPDSGTTNITIPVATTSADGAMSSSDKAKLDGITNYVASASVSGSTLTLTPNTGSAVTFTADENVIESISVNGTAVTPDANKNVALTVPTAAASTDTPEMDGTAAVGSSDAYARADHVHPSDTAKADKVSSPTAGNLVQQTSDGNITDAGVAATDLITGVKLEGASNPLTPTSGVVTIPNAVSTGTSGATNGLMTANQSLMLDQIGAWTWSYAEFGDSGMVGSEQTASFPFAVSNA